MKKTLIIVLAFASLAVTDAQNLTVHNQLDSLSYHSMNASFYPLLMRILSTPTMKVLKYADLDSLVSYYYQFENSHYRDSIASLNYDIIFEALTRLADCSGQNDSIFSAILRFRGDGNNAEGSEFRIELRLLAARGNPKAFLRLFRTLDQGERDSWIRDFADQAFIKFDPLILFQDFAVSKDAGSYKKDALRVAKMIQDRRAE